MLRASPVWSFSTARSACTWWVIEIREEKGLLATQPFVEQFLYETISVNIFPKTGP